MRASFLTAGNSIRNDCRSVTIAIIVSTKHVHALGKTVFRSGNTSSRTRRLPRGIGIAREDSNQRSNIQPGKFD